MSASSIDTLADWLVDGAPGATDSASVLARIGEDLYAAGVPVHRISAFVRTLHPTVVGRAFRWSIGKQTEVFEPSHDAFVNSSVFADSPVRVVVDTQRELHMNIGPKDTPQKYPVLDDLAAEGFVDYFAAPLVFLSGETHAITFATKAEAGFSDTDLHSIRRIVRPLARIAEILALRRTAGTLLSTYVGRNCGDRILAGRIQKGDFETLRAVIWFSDLRSFTELTARASTREVIAALNSIFECQVPSIEKHGGEVLKFMGDGMLAIFPFAEGDDAAKVADRALDAAHETLRAIAALAPLRIGLALHVGELAYGNIGGSQRLDFTAIGPAVNLTSRLEGLTSKLARPIVLSEELAKLTTRPADDLGTFELKGVAAPVRVFAPRPPAT